MPQTLIPNVLEIPNSPQRRRTKDEGRTHVVLEQDVAGILTMLAGLLARRSFNIESLAVGQAEQPEVARK